MERVGCRLANYSGCLSGLWATDFHAGEQGAGCWCFASYSYFRICPGHGLQWLRLPVVIMGGGVCTRCVCLHWPSSRLGGGTRRTLQQGRGPWIRSSFTTNLGYMAISSISQSGIHPTYQHNHQKLGSSAQFPSELFNLSSTLQKGECVTGQVRQVRYQCDIKHRATLVKSGSAVQYIRGHLSGTSHSAIS